jgi:hypothetical protein
MTRRRVFVVAGEYSASPRDLTPARRRRDFFGGPHPELRSEEVSHLFFRYPNRSDDGRTRPEDWERAFGIREPVALPDLLASAAHRALTTLHELTGRDWRRTCHSITDMLVTSMPGLDPNERVNIGLVPQALQIQLGLSARARAQFVVGTSDSGAQAFAEAVRAARTAEGPATILVLAGQIIPGGYVSQYQIRTVLGEDDQARGLDMLAVGDLVMDVMRRSFDLPPRELERLLARVAARKAQVGANYPAGINAGKPFRRDTRRTPWFDASDIAVPCCGAAATIVTSDEELIQSIAVSKHPRFRTAPLTEVLGVADGSTNPDLLHRKAPLLFAPAVYGALAGCADDAMVPVSTFTSCAFGVVHDAFPSIELSFLLALGLGWDRSAERMAEGWSNPVGGLLTFGHALGASGLVQVNKAHHLFCVDRRYLLEAESRQGFRSDGALAFTTSVGGPLSHIVCSLFRGGHQDRWPPPQRPAGTSPFAPVSAAWEAKARLLRVLLPSQLRSVPNAWLVEGTTAVSIRSCLRALSAEDVARLRFEGLEDLVAPQFLPEVRDRLRTVVRVVQQESERLGSMFDVFRLLTDEVREIAAELRTQGRLHPAVAGLDERRLVDRIKEALRVSLAVLSRPTEDGAHRLVRFVGPGELQDADFAAADALERVEAGHDALPFWTVRAVRPERPPQPSSTSEAEPLGEIAARGPLSAAELRLLRTWFSLDPPRPLLERAFRDAGLAIPERAPVRALFYAGEVADPGPQLTPREAHELLGFVAHRARAFLEAYQSAATQVGPVLSVVAFERPPVRGGDAALFSAARFAQEIARSALDQGVVVRAAVCVGEGTVFEDVNGRSAVTSPAARRATELLASARAIAPDRAAFALEGVSDLVVTLLGQRLAGWERAVDGPQGTAIWLGPRS